MRDLVAEQKRMVQQQLEARGIRDPLVLKAMATVRREKFMPDDAQSLAYADQAVAIDCGQTISQPYIVALMTQEANLQPESRVLEIGTGCGYQTAILASIVNQVFTVEIIPDLFNQAHQRLDELGFKNIEYLLGDGRLGWKEQGPFDVILAAAAPAKVPEGLIEQLKVGGRLIIPVGDQSQKLLTIERDSETTSRILSSTPVAFVPMTGDSEI